jgi:hypothetical protein
MIAHVKRIILSDDPANRIEDGPQMQFRLTAEQQIFASQPGQVAKRNGDKRADHKHELRQKFHFQLKRLWEITPFLNTGKSSGPALEGYAATDLPSLVDRDRLAAMHSHFGFRFVPLATKELCLLCGLDFLLLRPDPVGEVRSGDIDNRVKTIIDALCIPDANQRYHQRVQDAEINPMYCLLENDRLITKLSVETDHLLERISPQWDMSDARAIITVHLRPYELHFGNLGFGA